MPRIAEVVKSLGMACQDYELQGAGAVGGLPIAARDTLEDFEHLAVFGKVGVDQRVRGLEIVHVGWKDPDEKHLFRRVE